MSFEPQRLFVCCIPGLDARLVDAATTPYLDSLRREHRALRTLPTMELVAGGGSNCIATSTRDGPHQAMRWRSSPDTGQFSAYSERNRSTSSRRISLPALAKRLPTGERLLEFLEMYALDLMQHWHLDNAEVMQDALSRTDWFVRELHARCRERGQCRARLDG